MTTAAAELGVLFPKIETLNYPPGTVSAADLAAVAKTWPKLKRILFASFTQFSDDAFANITEVMPELAHLDFTRTKVADRHLTSISRLKKTIHLRLFETGITDASLPSLQTMRALKILDVTKTQVTDAGVAAFKKARPDVEVKR